MKGREHNVARPMSVLYAWGYVDDSNQRCLPSHVDASAAGSAHVHLAQLATITGKITDELFVDRSPINRICFD